ncbi:MAG: YebC/PmpR family DNA-binding transcriptional regulator [Dehalococcoidaceae bacterium]|nr:YebC/PmpR family DNA-binding transcriptional regulator [Dehalococcoidaceae bacterium]|tara:strand:+ start:33 stop:767 length:735 start_codon:yes stop_codon:yes gene_type:complete
MSGHSKWSSIKHKKGALDAKRGKLFTKLSRDITLAAKTGDQPESNSSLRLAIQKAKDANMPNANIERAIKKASGVDKANQLEEITYEGYGPGGSAIIVDAVTDNKNRTASEVRLAFNRNNGNLGESGVVAWQFKTKGLLRIENFQGDLESVQLAAIDSGAEDINIENNNIEIVTDASTLEKVRLELAQQNISIDSMEIARIADNLLELDENDVRKTIKLLEALDDLDDVSRVQSNIAIPDQILA